MLSVEDVVIVHERLPRGLWKLGQLGHDGHYRAAIVKTTCRDGRPEQFRRPIQLLYPLESKSTFDSYEISLPSTEIVSPIEEPPTTKDGEDMTEQGTDTPAEPRRRSKRVNKVMSGEKRVCD